MLRVLAVKKKHQICNESLIFLVTKFSKQHTIDVSNGFEPSCDWEHVVLLMMDHNHVE